MKNADLHTHSKYSSDGELTPTELVKKAKEAGLKYIAITDHDSVAGVEEALKAGKEFGIEVIPGVEIHSMLGEVIGLFIDHKNKALIAACAKNKALTNERAIKIIDLLKKDNINLDIEEIKKRYKTEVVERPHIAFELVRKGYAKSFRDSFNRFIAKSQKYFTTAEFPPTTEIIKIIKQAGGLSILAHPYYENYKEEFRQIKAFIAAGLVGIELFSGSFRPLNYEEVAKQTKQLAEEHNLILTSGSDFHGKVHSKNELGKFNCDEEVVAQLKQLLS